MSKMMNRFYGDVPLWCKQHQGEKRSKQKHAVQLTSKLCLPIICYMCLATHTDADNFLARVDRDIFNAIYDTPPRREPIGVAMENITYLGDARTMMGLSIILMAYGDNSHRETGRLMSSAFIGTGAIIFGMKEIVRRKRPLDNRLGNPAFPSGHTAYAFAAATVLSDRYPKLRIPFYIGASLVGLSRIYLGRHYTSDVIGGAAVGTITGSVILHHRLTLLKLEF